MPSESKVQPGAQQLCGAPSDPQGRRPGATCTWPAGHPGTQHHDAGYYWGTWARLDMHALYAIEFKRLAEAAEKELREKAEALLYRCIVELEYVQCVPASLKASAVGRELVVLGMDLLGAKNLREAELEQNAWYAGRLKGETR